MRKLISFLGTGKYSSCQYEFNGHQATETRFIQTAIAELFFHERQPDDKVYIFMTKEASERNWENYTWSNPQEPEKAETTEGLKEAAARIIPGITIKTVMMSSGQSEEDNRALFNQMYDIIEEGDEIYFDVTHGFRSFPIMTLIILNYARFLKNARFGKMLYGCYEARQGNTAPIVDFTDMISLLDWTGGVERFLDTGDTSMIQKLTDSQKARLMMQGTKTQRLEAQKLGNLAANLDKFSQMLQTCRGQQLDAQIQKVKKSLREATEVETREFQPLGRLLDKIDEKIEGFTDDEIMNGYHAAVWCASHRLTQQGFTLLVENIITAICRGVDRESILNREKREDTGAVLRSLSTEGKKDPAKWRFKDEAFAEKVRDYLLPLCEMYPDLPDKYVQLAEYRNNINHAEMNKEMKYQTLHKALPDMLEYFKPVFMEMSSSASKSLRV